MIVLLKVCFNQILNFFNKFMILKKTYSVDLFLPAWLLFLESLKFINEEHHVKNAIFFYETDHFSISSFFFWNRWKYPQREYNLQIYRSSQLAFDGDAKYSSARFYIILQ